MSEKQKIFFITYGSSEFNISKKHLINLAKYSNIFDECIDYSFKDLSTDFKKKYSNILNHERGGGYWVWKHEIINNALKELNKNDLVVYCDAGTSFNYHAKKRFFEYIEILNDSKFSNFRIESEEHHIEKYWTTKEIFNFLNIDIDSNIANSTQFEGGHLIFKSNEDSKEYFNEYKKLLDFDENLITDFYNKEKQIDGFNENRHDQSIFSTLSKLYGSEYIKNETKFKNNIEKQYDFPFLSVRRRGHGIKDRLKFAFNYKNVQNTPSYFE